MKIIKILLLFLLALTGNSYAQFDSDFEHRAQLQTACNKKADIAKSAFEKRVRGISPAQVMREEAGIFYQDVTPNEVRQIVEYGLTYGDTVISPKPISADIHRSVLIDCLQGNLQMRMQRYAVLIQEQHQKHIEEATQPLAENICAQPQKVSNFYPALAYVVNDPVRVNFFTAPNEACIRKNVFVIKGDQLIAYSEFGKWLQVSYFAKNGPMVEGWVLSNHLKSTGNIGPVNH